MCRKHEAREAREALGGAIDRFAGIVNTISPPPPPLPPTTRTLRAVAEIYRGAAATVPLPLARKAS